MRWKRAASNPSRIPALAATMDMVRGASAPDRLEGLRMAQMPQAARPAAAAAGQKAAPACACAYRYASERLLPIEAAGSRPTISASNSSERISPARRRPETMPGRIKPAARRIDERRDLARVEDRYAAGEHHVAAHPSEGVKRAISMAPPAACAPAISVALVTAPARATRLRRGSRPPSARNHRH